MRIPYSFSILRYIHDPITEEFLNIGVLVFSKEAVYLNARCTTNYERISKMFAKIDGERFRQLTRYVESEIRKLANEFADTPSRFSLEAVIARVLPPDDSAFRFSTPGIGLSHDLDATTMDMFDRFVQKYNTSAEPVRRNDEDVWKVYRQPLERRHVMSKLVPKEIATQDYSYRFDHSWKNEIWHMYEPLSLDLVDAGSMADKANRWVGRATILTESAEPWKIHMLLGEPKEPGMKAAFTKAENILHKMPGKHEFVKEAEAEEFAEMVANEMKSHGNIS
jgi:hypothetical protein